MVKKKKKKPVPHAIPRALERYGVKLNADDLRAMAFQCYEGNGCLRKMENGTEIHIVKMYHKAIVVAYRPSYNTTKLADSTQAPGTIITVLPKEAALSGKSRSPATRSKSIRAKTRAPKKNRKRRGY